VASLHAQHQRGCALSRGRTSGATTRPRAEGCTCQPTYHIFARAAGKQVRQRIGRNLKNAERELTHVQVREDEGSFEAPKNIRLDAWADQWRASLECKENTRDSYASTVDWAKRAFGGKNVRQVTPGDIASLNVLMRSSKLSDSTRAKHLRVLHACFESAAEHGYAARNPVKRLPKSERPRAKRTEAAYFTNEELPRLVTALDDSLYRTLIVLAVKTGMRQGELLALRWGDVELFGSAIHVRRSISHGYVSETKNRENRDVHVPPAVVDLLGSWWNECGKPSDECLVFPSDAGGYLSPFSALNRLRAAMKAAGVPLVGPTGTKRTFHSLRHTFAKVALENGSAITWLSRHLGHQTTAITTDTYGHFESATAKQQAERLEGAFRF
jgi:integrase